MLSDRFWPFTAAEAFRVFYSSFNCGAFIPQHDIRYSSPRFRLARIQPFISFLSQNDEQRSSGRYMRIYFKTTSSSGCTLARHFCSVRFQFIISFRIHKRSKRFQKRKVQKISWTHLSFGLVRTVETRRLDFQFEQKKKKKCL